MTDRPSDIPLPAGWTWDMVEASRAKWDIASNMVPIVTAPGCTAWGTINSVRLDQDDCFRNWLNRVDARVEYETRRALGSVSTWRKAFDLGQSENEAIADLQYARDNRAFCNV